MENNKHNPKQKAVALSYTRGDVAPSVVGKGEGYLAEKIIEVGAEAKVPIVQDKKLVEELTRIDLGENIPPELYQVVAEVLVFISNIDTLEEYKKYGK
jgi:flagellar biosynthesis protein